MSELVPPTPRRKRWGLRALAALGLAVLGLVTAQAQGFQSWGTAGCTAIGVLVAAYCSWRGWRSMEGMARIGEKQRDW